MSPFPGMDPFLETRWGDCSSRFTTYLSDAINPALPPQLRARMEERVFVEVQEDEDQPTRTQVYKPDTHVHEQSDIQTGGAGTAMLETVAEPVKLQPTSRKQRSIVIRDESSGQRVVTVIEVLNPTNKAGRGRQEYVDKQDDYLAAGVNLLELDLVRGGRATTVAAQSGIPDRHRSTYHASLAHGPHRRDWLEMYPIRLDAPLPRIALPLRPSDRPIALDLQAVFNVTYERGYYHELDYDAPLEPRPTRDEAAYIADRVAAWRAERQV